jgi:hypothetical protein
MSLAAEKKNLQISIEDAFAKLLNIASNPGATSDNVNPMQLIKELAKDLTESIHSYTTSAEVNLSGVSTETAAPVPVQVAPATGTGTTATNVISNVYNGFGKLQ